MNRLKKLMFFISVCITTPLLCDPSARTQHSTNRCPNRPTEQINTGGKE